MPLSARALTFVSLLATFSATSLLVSLSATGVRAGWIQSADMPRDRAEHAVVNVDDRYVYVLGGMAKGVTPITMIDRFDTLTGAWTLNYDRFPAGRARNHFNAVVEGGFVYLVGGKTGSDATGVAWVDRWNPRTRAWTRLPNLPDKHWGGPTVVVDGELHAVSGGVNHTRVTDHHFVLDLDQSGAKWRSETPIPVASVHGAGFELDGKLYVIHGESGHDHPETAQKRDVYAYNPANNTWAAAGQFPTPRNHAEWSTVEHVGVVYSAGGVNSELTPRGQDELYLGTRSGNAIVWREDADKLPYRAVGAAAAVVDDALWLFGGWQDDWVAGNLTRDVWRLELSAENDSGTRLEGDYDGDGLVTVSDGAVWESEYGTTGPQRADGNVDSVVNSADFTVWRDNLGASADQAASVPEPPTALVAGLALLLLASGRFAYRSAAGW